jgi:hypothetical protein
MSTEDDVTIPSKDDLLNPEASDGRQEQVLENTDTPSLSDVEQRAVARGWTPKDQWKGNPADWRPADVWLDRGEMLGTIQHLREKVATTEKQVAEAFKQGRELAKARYEDELKLLREMKREALQEHDLVKADAIGEKIDDLKTKIAEPLPKPAPVDFTPPPEYSIFVERNPWYANPNNRLRYVADGIGLEFMKANPKASAADLYFFVEKEMQKEYPELYGKPKATPKAPPQPEGGERTANAPSGGKGTTSAIKASMNEMERSIMKTLVSQGVFKTEEEYLKEYSASRR